MKVLILLLLTLTFFWGCQTKASSVLGEVLAAFSLEPPKIVKTYSSSQTPVDPVSLSVGGEPVLLLNPLGDNSPKAQFNFSTTSVDRYRNLSIVFSHPINPSTLVEGTTFQFIRLATNTPITGSSFIWDSPVNLVIDPPQELAAGEQYNIQMTSGVKTTDNQDLTPFNGIFTTEPAFTMTHTINGIPLYPPGNNGLTLDKTLHPTLTLTSTITFPDQIASLKLCKLGFLADSPYVVCKASVASGIEICSNPPNGSVPACSSSFSTNITSLVNDGGNHLFYQIETPNGKKIIRSLNFNYGNVASPAQGASVIKKTANLTSGNPTIVVSSSSGITTGMIVSGNGIPLDAKVLSISGNNITLSANATTTASGVSVSFSPDRLLNVARLFLDKQTGTNESKSTVRALENLVKSYARGDFTLDNKTLNQFINSSTSNTPPTLDGSGNSCLAWNRTKKGNTTSGSNIVSVENTTGLAVGMPISGSGIPSGTTVTSFTSNTVTLSNNATATASNVSLNFNFTNAYGITYLNKIGPFCGIMVSGAIFESSYYPNVNYTATADIYVTEVEILETANPGNVDNLNLNLNPRDGYLDLVLYGKKAKGKLAVVAKVVSIEFFDYLVGDTFIFYGNSLAGTDGDSIGFAMNEDPPSLTDRLAFARTQISAGANGMVNILSTPNLFPNPYIPGTSCNSIILPVTNPYPYACNPFTTEWSNAIIPNSVTGSGAVASIIADVINQKIDEVKPQVVQGVVRDVAQNIAPEIINNIIGQLMKGVEINLPDYLPSPLDRVRLYLSAKVQTDMASKESGGNAGLDASADISISACVRDSANKCPGETGYVAPPTPPSPHAGGSDGYIVFKAPATKLPSQLTKSSSNPGLLLSLHSDALNQAFYHIWKGGGLNFNIDRDFINKVNQFVGENNLLKLTESLLKADPIITVFSPGVDQLPAGPGDPAIYKNDDVVLRVNPLLAPVISIPNMSGGSPAQPRVSVSLADLEISVLGKKSDETRIGKLPPDDYNPNAEYLIAKVRVTVTTKANVSFNNYTLPPAAIIVRPATLTAGNPTITSINTANLAVGMNVSGTGIPSNTTIVSYSSNTVTLSNAPTSSGTGVDLTFNWVPSLSILSSVGNSSLRLSISSADGDLYYIVEPLEGVNNPRGLNPSGIWEVLDPLVKSLIIPLLNNILRDVPLPKIRACGLEVNNLKVLNLQPTEFTNPFVLLNGEVGSYNFTENCAL